MVALLSLASLSAAVWVAVAIGRGGFWRTTPRLEPGPPPSRWPSVAIVVPARDEAELLPLTLASLLAQRYPGRAEVVLVDDHSEDGTGAVARSLVGAPGALLPLRVLEAPERPPGWAGKLWALHHGLAEVADAELVLFTDADVTHPPGSLAALVSAAASGGYDQVSLMVKLRARSGWERLLVPAFVYLFAMLYPFGRVDRPPSRHAAAAGGCILLRREALEAAGGVAAVRDAVIDDVSLAQALARSGARLWLGYATDVESVRRYDRLAELWTMVTRSAFAQLRWSTPALLGTVLGLLALFWLPLACLALGIATGDVPVAALGGGAWAIMAATYLPMQRYYGLGPWRALTLPLAALFYLAMTADSARRHWTGRGTTWKGRRYGARARGEGRTAHPSP